MEKKINAVFEGGGVKGIALVGAVTAFIDEGYILDQVAGTSAGAIVASLLAAGYNQHELLDILYQTNYNDFKDKTWLDKVPLLGPPLNIILNKGLYAGNYFEEWLRELLAAKGVHTFGDLVRDNSSSDPRTRYRLQVVASDISRGQMLVLPGDLKDYELDIDSFDVAKAVRMSMSIPFFFEPVQLQGEYIVDGGVLSNYPVWMFDLDDETPCPTIGFKLVDPKEGQPNTIIGPITLFKALFGTMMEAHDARYIEDKNFARTVPIPTLGVQTIDFNLPRTKASELYVAGYQASQDFLKAWDFDQYKTKFSQSVSRSEKLLAPSSSDPLG